MGFREDVVSSEKDMPEAYSTADLTSFGYSTAQDRWPSILTNTIDDLNRTIFPLAADEKEKIEEGKAIIRSISALKYEVQHNRPLSPLPDDGSSDIALYNDELEYRDNPLWHNVQWLYAECYIYRRIATMFRLSTLWKTYDPFARQKMSTFKSSRPAVLEMAARYRDIITQLERQKSVVDTDDPEKVAEAERVLFIEMMDICLWGNATDLSLLTSLTYEDIQKLQGSNARKESEGKVLVNDLPAAFEMLNKLKQTSTNSSRRVDIVLDNAGFELFVDLVLAGYLIATDLATEMVLHPKNIPWFVSDALPKDFSDLLNAMADPKAFYERPDDENPDKKPAPLTQSEAEDIQFLFEHWSSLHEDGRLVLRPNAFWTHAGSFWRMPTVTPDLYEDLQQSELVVFKGDLNYRKLCGDATWPADTPFHIAIGPLAGSIRTLALRTCKADAVVGLPAGKDREVREMTDFEGDKSKGSLGDGSEESRRARKWAWSGKWAVVQYCDGRKKAK